jgi:hypothetical protein
MVAASPPIERAVAPVSKSVAVVFVVVRSPPLTAISPVVDRFPFEPVIEKLVAVMSFAPRESAFTISESERSSAFVIAPPAELN